MVAMPPTLFFGQVPAKNACSFMVSMTHRQADGGRSGDRTTQLWTTRSQPTAVEEVPPSCFNRTLSACTCLVRLKGVGQHPSSGQSTVMVERQLEVREAVRSVRWAEQRIESSCGPGAVFVNTPGSREGTCLYATQIEARQFGNPHAQFGFLG